MLRATVTHTPHPPQMRAINHRGTKLESKKRNRVGYFGEPLITRLLVQGGTVELALR